MTFNYAAERKKFEKNWAETEALYRKHGREVHNNRLPF